MNPTNTTVFDVWQKVDQFYSTSWSHLLIYTSVLVALVGVIVPILIQSYQTRLFRSEETALLEKLRAQIATDLKIASSALEAADKVREKTVLDRIADESKKLEERIAETRSEALGSVYHIQGNQLEERKDHFGAVVSYSKACREYLGAKNEADLRRVLNGITNRYLSDVTREAVQEADSPSLQFELAELIKVLQGANEHGKYRDDISALDSGFRRLFKAPPPSMPSIS